METASLQLPKDLIESAIQQNIQKALAEAFSDNKYVIGDIVSNVLSTKVDKNLKPCSYSSSRPLIEQTLNNALVYMVQKILTEEIGNYKDAIREHLLNELKKKRSPLIRDLVNGMTEGVVSAMSNKWRVSVVMDKD